MKAFNHDNVNEFVGMCINLLDVYVVTGHCQKGSLQVCALYCHFTDNSALTMMCIDYTLVTNNLRRLDMSTIVVSAGARELEAPRGPVRGPSPGTAERPPPRAASHRALPGAAQLCLGPQIQL